MLRYLAFILILLPLQLLADSELTFGTSASYPPFVYIDYTGKVQGFDAELVAALCQEMHRECVVKNQAWASLIPSLQLGKFQGLVGGMSITAAREKQVAFTHPYYQSSATYITMQDSDLKTIKDIKGKKVGAQEGTVMEEYIRQKYGRRVKVLTYPNQINAFMDLKAGRIDAVLSDTPVALNWLKNHPHAGFQQLGAPFTDKRFFGDGFAIAVNLNDKTLLKALNKALDQFNKEGGLGRLKEKYFGVAQ